MSYQPDVTKSPLNYVRIPKSSSFTYLFMKPKLQVRYSGYVPEGNASPSPWY